MKKSLLAVLICAVAGLGLAACGKKESHEHPQSQEHPAGHENSAEHSTEHPQ